MKLRLRVFVAEDCPNCREAQVLAVRIAKTYPRLQVEIVDMKDEQALVPEIVFATPTFMLNNRIVSLGNPTLSDVAKWLKVATVDVT